MRDSPLTPQPPRRNCLGLDSQQVAGYVVLERRYILYALRCMGTLHHAIPSFFVAHGLWQWLVLQPALYGRFLQTRTTDMYCTVQYDSTRSCTLRIKWVLPLYTSSSTPSCLSPLARVSSGPVRLSAVPQICLLARLAFLSISISGTHLPSFLVLA